MEAMKAGRRVGVVMGGGSGRGFVVVVAAVALVGFGIGVIIGSEGWGGGLTGLAMLAAWAAAVAVPVMLAAWLLYLLVMIAAGAVMSWDIRDGLGKPGRGVCLRGQGR